MTIPRSLRLLFIMVLGLLLPAAALAWCGDCEANCCTCPGEPQCLGSHASCDEACGLVPPKLDCPEGMKENSAGTKCLPVASVECGDDLYCKEGYQCGTDGGCVKAELIPCGKGKYCKAGMKCGSGEHCLQPDDIDCGDGVACKASEQCAAGGCIPKGTILCGTGYCYGSDRCVAGRCVSPNKAGNGGAARCGTGYRFDPNYGCMRQ